MLIGLLAAAVIATQQPQPITGDPDLRCMMAMSFALAEIDGGEAKADDEERSGIVALMMYYVGKIDGRIPDFDYAKNMTSLVETPGYAETQLPNDLVRCGEEAVERGRTLKELSEQLQDLIPLIEKQQS